MTSPLIPIIIGFVSVAVWMWLSLRFVHLLQLESYQNKMYIKAVLRSFLSSWVPLIIGEVVATIVIIVLWQLLLSDITMIYIAAAISLIVGATLAIVASKRKQKKPLVFTARIKRLLCCIALVGLIFYFGAWLIINSYFIAPITMFFPVIGIIVVPVIVLLAAYVAYPIEQFCKRMYFNDAKRKLEACDNLIKIGITGSFGKTSTKFIMGTILKQKFKTIITPHSYNTPMGVTRVIRENDMNNYEVFVCEMGARYKGDIKELCSLVNPTYGIITSIGKQHLETFKSLEGVISTKYELIEALPNDGCAFFPADNEICVECYDRTDKPKELFGLAGGDRELSVCAKEYKTGINGSEFILEDADGNSVNCTTKLLGRHNIQNILGAACVARRLGMTVEEIATGIEMLEPVEHRLQLIHSPNGVIIIDDAFNSNPTGAKAALDVLSTFDSGKRIIVTPGMVELGDQEKQLNKQLGIDMASCVEHAILVGKTRSIPIAEGLRSVGFNEEYIHTVDNLDEATVIIGQLARKGDVILFENDLPDNY